MNRSGDLQIKSLLDGGMRNRGVARYRGLNCKHVQVTAKGHIETPPNSIYICVQTMQSRMEVAAVVQHTLYCGENEMDDKKIEIFEEDTMVGHIYTVPMRPGRIIVLEKVAAICSNRDRVSNSHHNMQKELKSIQ
jgi:trehalose/maltose hydrolase-like predicted phosphorylase